MRVLAAIFIVALSLFAIFDVARTPRDLLPARLGRVLWLLLVIIVPVIGPTIWILMRYKDTLLADTVERNKSNGRPIFGSLRKTNQTGPVAPDDDPEFLARLEAQNRRRAYEEQRRRERGEEEEPTTPKDEDDEPEGGLYGRRD